MRKAEVHIDLHLVLLRDGCLLMGKRLNTQFGAGQYHVPAGHLEADETIVDGIRREAREETSIEIAADAVDLAYVLHFRGQSGRLSLFFRAERWQGAIENREPEKCAGWQWIATGSLPANTVPYAKYAINELLAGRRLGLFGWPDG